MGPQNITPVKEQNMLVKASTPVKMNERKSVSLLDISQIDNPLEKSKTHTSSDTLGSNSSICKDSGCNLSDSSLTSDKIKESGTPFPIDYREKYLQLLEDLKYKDVMISTLYESNYTLRMKIAEAENKIFELRLKCESHCKCCTNQSSVTSPDYTSPSFTKQQFKYSVSPHAVSEPCLLVQSKPKEDIKLIDRKKNKPPTLPSENSYIKVKQWQNTYKECEKRLVESVSPPTIEQQQVNKIYFRPVPQPLPQTMSYMETARALAETYQKRKGSSPDLFSFQVIGDHSVAVSPVQLVQNCRIPEGADSYINESVEKSNNAKEEFGKEIYEQSSGRQSLLGNIFFRNQTSNGLFDCLNKANEYAASLTVGLSKLPNSLNEIRSISSQTK